MWIWISRPVFVATATERLTMSKNQNPQSIKNIEIGKFYFIHDSSKTGHPGYVVWKDDDENLYLAIKFGSSPNVHNFVFGRAVGRGIEQSYIYKRVFLGKRKDFGRTTLDDMQISKEEFQKLVNKVDFCNPTYSKNINRKDRRNYKKLYVKRH